MTSLSTITHLVEPRTLSIFFPLAEFDLDDFLFHKKTSDRICQYPDASPMNLMQEFAGLAHALDFLHNGIRSAEGGEPFVCIHHDLKPDNVLVVAEVGAPVGRWKVTDFGLSRVKEAKIRDPVTGATIYEHDPSVRASLTSPKRHPGAFQPPEIEQQGGKAIGPKSDIWGLGGILCLVLMYAIGGVPKVEDFERRRYRQQSSEGSDQDYEHDYYYRGNEINPELLSPLEEAGKAGDWAQKCVEIILDMLQIEPFRRPSAKKVETQLFERVLPELRKGGHSGASVKSHQNQTMRDDHATLEAQIQLKGKAPMTGPSVDALGPIPPAASPEFLGSDLINWAPYPSPNPISDTRYIKFNLDGLAAQTSFSHTGEHVAFLYETKVFVHSMTLLEANGRWAGKPSKGTVQPSEGTFLVICAPKDIVWKAMSFPGHYLALRGSQKRQHDYVSHRLLN